MEINKIIFFIIFLCFYSSVWAAPSLNYRWDSYTGYGASYFVLSTKVDNGEYVDTPHITPITETTYSVDFSGRPGNNASAHMIACRPGIYATPPQVPDECSDWSNEVVGNIDIAPPVISNPFPTGILASGTTQTTLQVITALEVATCKYGTSDVAYSSLPNTFSSDLSSPQTTHTQLINVTGGSAYTFYVRCKDVVGNENTSSTIISFSVASGDTTRPTISNITSNPSTGTFRAGQPPAGIATTVTFNELVTSTGNVTVTFETGATDEICTFTVTNSTSGTCTYNPAAGDTTSDLNASVSGTINDQASPPNQMNNFTPVIQLSTNSSIVIDTTAPTNQNTVFAASQTVTASASVSIVSAGETGGAVWFAPSGTTTFVAGPTMTTASGTATTLQAPTTRGAYRLFVIDLAGNVSTQSTAILTVAWTVTPSVSGGNGTIAPSSPVLVANGATYQFTLTPATGYTGSGGGTCGGSLVGQTYTTSAVTANCTVIASFADSQGPTVSVTAPTAGQVVTGTAVPVTATASDNSGTVASVQFKLDTVPIGSLDTSSPFGIIWNTTTASEGEHTLTATATDPTGNPTTSSGVAVTVDNEAPALSLLGPSGAQAKTTANIPLVVTTNELAICRFDPNCSTAFGSMTLFSSDSSRQTSHSNSLPVWAGASYRYCIKCQDISGNTSPGTYIYFSINAKPKQDLLH